MILVFHIGILNTAYGTPIIVDKSMNTNIKPGTTTIGAVTKYTLEFKLPVKLNKKPKYNQTNI